MKPCILAHPIDSMGYPANKKTSLYSGKLVRLHVFILEKDVLGRAIDPEKECRHSCDIRNCIESTHLSEGTPAQNAEDAWLRGRGRGWGGIQSKKTHCPKGHEYTPENTDIIRGSKGDERRCKICYRERARLYQQKKRAEWAKK